MKNISPNQTKLLSHRLLISLCLLSLVFACTKLEAKSNDGSSQNLPIELIQADKEISNCKERNLDNKILLITSRYCPHCKEVIKTLTPLITKRHLENSFQVLDVINKDDLEILNKSVISLTQVPILIINCAAYVGEKKISKYEELLDKFSRKTKKEYV